MKMITPRQARLSFSTDGYVKLHQLICQEITEKSRTARKVTIKVDSFLQQDVTVIADQLRKMGYNVDCYYPLEFKAKNYISISW